MSYALVSPADAYGAFTLHGGRQMSIREALKAATAPTRTGFELWLDTLNQDDRDALIEAAPLPNISHRAFHDIVKANGATVGKERLTAWRKSLGFPS